MIRRVKATGLRPKGMLWYQGESDANEKDSKTYLDRFLAFAARLRADLGEPGLPILTVQIGRVTQWGDAAGWDAMRETQRLVPTQCENVFVTTGVDGALADQIHLDLPAQRQLGERLARLALTRVYKKGPFGDDIRLHGLDAFREGDKLRDSTDVERRDGGTEVDWPPQRLRYSDRPAFAQSRRYLPDRTQRRRPRHGLPLDDRPPGRRAWRAWLTAQGPILTATSPTRRAWPCPLFGRVWFKVPALPA